MSAELEMEVHKECSEEKPPSQFKSLDLKKNPLLISILECVDSLKEMTAEKVLPQEYLNGMKGFLFMKTSKIGLGISMVTGYGLVVARCSARPSGWSAPLPVKVEGFSAGAVIGWSEQKQFVCFANESDLNTFKLQKRKINMGVDLGLSLGDQGSATAQLDQDMAIGEKDKTTGLKTKAFQLSKGMMIDVAVKGISVETDKDDLVSAYGPDVNPADILSGVVAAPRETLLLYRQLKEMMDKYSAPV